MKPSSGSPLRLATFVVLFALANVFAGVEGTLGSPIWPEPSSILTIGNQTLALSSDFSFSIQGRSGKAVAENGVLKRAVSRYSELLKRNIAATTTMASTPTINSCEINVMKDPASTPKMAPSSDESYELSVDGKGACKIASNEVWGAIRALETLSQLFVRNSDNTITTSYIPISVADSPRFSHRGVLIDTSRHYLPVATITSLIDSLPIAKFNVLHWHTVSPHTFVFRYPCFITSSLVIHTDVGYGSIGRINDVILHTL
jgi:hexosaminidase